MKRYRVTTRQVIHQDWEYEVEIPEGFEDSRVLGALIWKKVTEGGIEGHCLDNDTVISEFVLDWGEIAAHGGQP